MQLVSILYINLKNILSPSVCLLCEVLKKVKQLARLSVVRISNLANSVLKNLIRSLISPNVNFPPPSFLASPAKISEMHVAVSCRLVCFQFIFSLLMAVNILHITICSILKHFNYIFCNNSAAFCAVLISSLNPGF